MITLAVSWVCDTKKCLQYRKPFSTTDLDRGLTEYSLCKGVACGEEVTHTIYICRARAGATKTLGLAVMQWKLNIFFNDTQDQLLHRWWRAFMHEAWQRQKFIWQTKKTMKRHSWFMKFLKEVRLKAAKSVSGKWILLRFRRETRTKSPYLPSKVTLAQLFNSFYVVAKRRNELQPCTTTSKISATTHKQSN